MLLPVASAIGSVRLTPFLTTPTDAIGLERAADSFGTAEVGSMLAAFAAVDNKVAAEHNFAGDSFAAGNSAADNFVVGNLVVGNLAVGNLAADNSVAGTLETVGTGRSIADSGYTKLDLGSFSFHMASESHSKDFSRNFPTPGLFPD